MRKRSLNTATATPVAMIALLVSTTSACGFGLLDGLFGGSPFARCGNDIKDGDEECDGDDHGGKSCADLGYGGGALACTEDCKVDDSGCGEVTCTPDCSGRECGPDPACGRSCGTCTSGSCVAGACRSDVSCPAAKDCTGRACGPDPVCGASCGSCNSGYSCNAAGSCQPASGCATSPPSVTGNFVTSQATFPFDAAEVDLIHARDIDPVEDGCIAEIDLVLTKGSGCRLEIQAYEEKLPTGGLVIQQLTFSADSQCPSFPNELEGTYTRTDNFYGEIRPAVAEVPGSNVAESCFTTSLLVVLEGVLQKGSDQLTVSRSQITVAGEFLSIGSTSYACPTSAVCNGTTDYLCDGDDLVGCQGTTETERIDCTDMWGQGGYIGRCGNVGGEDYCVMNAGSDCTVGLDGGGVGYLPCGSNGAFSPTSACVPDLNGILVCTGGFSSCTTASFQPYCQGDYLIDECLAFSTVYQLTGWRCNDPSLDWQGGTCSDALCRGAPELAPCHSTLMICAEGLSCAGETSTSFGTCQSD